MPQPHSLHPLLAHHRTAACPSPAAEAVAAMSAALPAGSGGGRRAGRGLCRASSRALAAASDSRRLQAAREVQGDRWAEARMCGCQLSPLPATHLLSETWPGSVPAPVSARLHGDAAAQQLLHGGQPNLLFLQPPLQPRPGSI